eukprot:jgi/Botrbrau1/19202/Bobra.0077s0105.1
MPRALRVNVETAMPRLYRSASAPLPMPDSTFLPTIFLFLMPDASPRKRTAAPRGSVEYYPDP